MRQLIAITLVTLPVAGSLSDDAALERKLSQVNAVLDGSHRAAAAADEDKYFSYFAPDAVFLGTDATERWTRDEFRAWAKPHFAKGKGWSFKPTRRNVTLSKDGNVAWFDEDLATAQLGPCRGSGVLVRNGDAWKIAQYNLSVPIPNDVFPDVKKIIESAPAAKKPDKQPN